MESAKERDTFVYLAKLSEQAERYEGKESSSYGFYESLSLDSRVFDMFPDKY